MDIEKLDQEELQVGDGDPRPARTRPLTWIMLAVVGLVAGYVVLGHGPQGSSSQSEQSQNDQSSHQNGPQPSPQPVSTPPAGPNERQYVGVSMVCPPVTDHRTRLAVSFQLTNTSESDVFVTSVRSVLPMRGLRSHGPAVGGTSCSTPEKRLARGLIAPAQSEFYTLNFDLPKKNCPAPYPVLVRVRFKAEGFEESSVSLLFSDLSVPDFDACPQRKS